MRLLDTGPIIWGFQRKARKPQAGRLEEMARFLQDAKAKRLVLGVPAPALAEVATGMPADEAEKLMASLQGAVRILPLDAPAALAAAEFMRDGRWKALAKKAKLSRDVTRTDALILGIAKARGAEAVISADKNMVALAAGRVQVVDIPAADALQRGLFDDVTEDA